jgi:hypothetical protein
MQSRNRCRVEIKLSVRVRVRVRILGVCLQWCVSERSSSSRDKVNSTTVFSFFFEFRTNLKSKHGEYQEYFIQL